MTTTGTTTLRSCLAALLLALTCLASDSKSGTDQYETHNQDQPYPLRSFSEAYKAIKSQHRFDLHPKKPLDKEEYSLDNDIEPDLQMGCGDGLLVETTTAKPVIPKYKRVYPKKERRKREVKGNRNSRSYFSYSVRTPSSFSYYTVFKPQTYKLQRPYYIPILGTEGRVPFYLPPQSLFPNTGFPLDNPPTFYNTPGKGYLPPSGTPTTSTETSTVGDRFGEMGPVWGSQPASSTTSRPLKTSTFPPLVHNPDPNMPSDLSKPAEIIRTTPRTTTTTTTRRATFAPPTSPPEKISAPAPNQCVLAIVNCCSAGSKTVSIACFERLGCPGPFWDSSPCEGEIAQDALSYALQYYQAK